MADGDISVDSDEQDEPDGRRLRGRSERPRVGLHVREHPPQRRACPVTVPDVVDGLERLDQHAGEQVDGIDDGQGLQQPVGGVGAVAVAPEDEHRQQIADDAGRAERADDVDVDHRAIEDVRRTPGRSDGPTRRRRRRQVRRRFLGSRAAAGVRRHDSLALSLARGLSFLLRD